ncbi:MAG TPA: hypothetical protein EYQ54_17755 [Myxococcales bacterium]|nr:hypothetical protein [Myxococcales bacterium]
MPAARLPRTSSKRRSADRAPRWAPLKIDFSIAFVVVCIGLTMVTSALADGIDDFNNGWIGRTLSTQRLLDINGRISDSNIIGAHNSFNSAVYTSATAYPDPNQVDSIYNQLRMGARSIEMDVHWTPKTEGLFQFPSRLLLCHGTGAHIGCSLDDRYFAEGLDEVAAWLNTAESVNQILLLHIEDHMDGQHSEAYNQVNDRFGDRVFFSGGCNDIPGDLTKSDVLSAGKNVIIWADGGCSGDGNWNSTVFTGLGALARVWEDSTTIGGIGGAGSAIGSNDVVSYFAGGTNIVDLDQLHQNDARLAAAIWSWDANEPNNSGDNEDCAVQHGNGRWNDDNCGNAYFFACENSNSGNWSISSAIDSWGAGALACDALGSDFQFSVPTNSQDNQALKTAKESAGLAAVWLNHDDRAAEGSWTITSSDDVFYIAGALSLSSGESIGGKTRLLKMEPNCNLVLYSVSNGVTGGGLWASGTANLDSGCQMNFQADGNLVVTGGTGQPRWASGTSGTSGAELHLQGDGNAVIYNGAGSPLWQTFTNYPGERDFAAGQFLLSSGQILHSQNRKLAMQADCDLVLSSFENGASGGTLWRSDTGGAGSGCYVDFQVDGNLVLYDSSGQFHWASGTSGTTGARLSLQADGNLVVYNGVSQPLWSTSTNTPSESAHNAGQLLLTEGQFIQTRNRKLEMQNDCNLALFSVENALVGSALWHSDTSGAGTGCYVDFQADGNFVVYDEFAQPKWASGTSGTAGAQLRLQSDGNLVVYNGASLPLWNSNTNIPDQSILYAGQFLLSSGQFVQTQSRRLEMQSDCNLVLSRVSNASPESALWHSNTSLAGANCSVDFQADGNLVVYDGNSQARWASGTSGTAGAQLWIQPDGNMVIYNGAGLPLWASQTPGPFSGAAVCGDLTCNGAETCSTCPGDCGTCPAVCGDFACNGGETCATCSTDCGACGGGGEFCGDFLCTGTESCTTCSVDCGPCPAVCGDLICAGGETCATCVDDCGTCSAPVCGDLTCNGSETCAECSGDCGTCAPPVCGDFVCNGAETCSTCQNDCGPCGGGNSVPMLSPLGLALLLLILSGSMLALRHVRGPRQG